MIALIQRVNWAQVHIDSTLHADIGQGILALIGIEKEDDDLNSSSKIRGGKVITTLRGIRRTVFLLFNLCRGIASHFTRK